MLDRLLGREGDPAHPCVKAARAKTPKGQPTLEQPPTGVWIRKDGEILEVGARTWPAATALIPAICTLICGVFLAMILWVNSEGLPRRDPSPAAHPGVRPGANLLAVFASGTAIWGAATVYTLMVAAGDVRVRLGGGMVRVASGVEPVRWRRRVRVADITGVREVIYLMPGNSGIGTVKTIGLERRGGKLLRLGWHLSETRRWWVRGMLRRILDVPDTTPGAAGESAADGFR